MHAMKPGLAGLLMILSAVALDGNSRTRWDIAPIFKIEPLPMPLAVQPVIRVQPLPLPRVGLWCGFGRPLQGREMCGGVIIPDFQQFRLKDPVGEIGVAYLKSRSVKATRFDSEFRVSDHPDGHFGSWVQDGLLVTERMEFTDEATLRQVFALLVEAIGEPDDEPYDWWLEAPGPKMSPADFRQHSGFVPELSFEFVGEVPLRVEFNLRQRRLLIQAADRWGVYALDRWSAAALRDLLTPR